jgi:hypothetical protein
MSFNITTAVILLVPKANIFHRGLLSHISCMHVKSLGFFDLRLTFGRPKTYWKERISVQSNMFNI